MAAMADAVRTNIIHNICLKLFSDFKSFTIWLDLFKDAVI
jgi:hypothetical protein